MLEAQFSEQILGELQPSLVKQTLCAAFASLINMNTKCFLKVENFKKKLFWVFDTLAEESLRKMFNFVFGKAGSKCLGKIFSLAQMMFLILMSSKMPKLLPSSGVAGADNIFIVDRDNVCQITMKIVFFKNISKGVSLVLLTLC